MVMVAKVVTRNIEALKNSDQTFETIFRIIRESFTGELFAEYLENGKIRKVTYFEFCKRVDLFAAAFLKKYGAPEEGKPRIAGIYLENSVDWVAIFWGLLRSGFKPLLLNTRHSLAVTNDIIDELKPEFVVSLDKRVKDAIRPETIIEGQPEYSAPEKDYWEDEVILVTSGSTSKPKIISHSGSTICKQVELSADIVKMNPAIQYNVQLAIKNLAFLPFYHIFGLVALLMWFSFFGRCFVFLPKYDVDSIQLVCRRIGVTHFFAIPLVWNKTVAALEVEVAKQGKTKTFNNAIDFSNKLQSVFPLLGATIARGIIFRKVRRQLLGEDLRFLISGGGFIQPRTLKVLNGLGYSIHNGYGLTECGVLSVELAKKPKFRNEGKVGKIFSNIAYKISDEGELLIPNDHSMYGMYIDGVFHKNEDEYYATNDTVKVDEKGRLSIVGRKDDVIIGPNGENISPEEIESRISKGGYSSLALVYVKLPGSDSKQMVLVLSDNGKLGAFELTTSLKGVYNSIDGLSLIERPSKVVSLIGEMPENLKGVDRRTLVAALEEGKLFVTECSNPSDEEIKRIRTDEYIRLIDTICGVFAEVLDKDRSQISETSNFVTLGGDSMQYVELLSKCGEKTGRQIMMTETPLITPMAIADYLITSAKSEKDIS
ncbi:MAG: hypothetical protein E7386_04900 [Ruminococcaceae bacterium]|nr:hypothetical protein [Oscillospiraceae bacterium]